MTNLMFKFEGVYKLDELAILIGKKLGINLICEKAGDVVHGHLSQTTDVNEKFQSGITILTICFYDYEEKPNWNEKNKKGHASHIKKYISSRDDFDRLQEVFLTLFNETAGIKKLTKKELKLSYKK